MKIGQRILLIVLLIWALAMIVPDVLRVVQPLGGYGFYADSDGLIYDVQGPFDRLADSPAYKAGLREGDHVNIEHLDCYPYDWKKCADALSIIGGRNLVLPGRPATVDLLASQGRPARNVTLVAEPAPSNPFERFVVGLDQIAGILVVVAAAWLVWTRPGPMSWGFFLYVMWFNPGQVYAFYAILQAWPLLLLVQNFLTAIAEAAGYAGLLLFVIRAPNDKPDARWQWLERLLPVIGALLAVVFMMSYGSMFGFRSEQGTRLGILAGLVIATAAVGILFERMPRLAPEDSQRLRWVVWGCLIGLPAFLFAELVSTTTMLETRLGDFTPSDDVIGLLYLINGVLCLFVFQAISSDRVVSVAIPLRRVTVLGLTLSIPALILHHEVEYMQEHLAIPNWAWLVIGGAALYLISKLHEHGTSLTDRYFNRDLDRMEKRVSEAILGARDKGEVDRLLTDEPLRALNLTSAATFRRNGGAYERDGTSHGWGKGTARIIPHEVPMLDPLAKGEPFAVAQDPEPGEPKLPAGLSRPVLAVPASSRYRCFAIAFYGPHAIGTDLDDYERGMLGRLGRAAGDAYAEIETRDLKDRVTTLERKLLESAPGPRKHKR